MNDFADRHLHGDPTVPVLSQLNVSLADGYSLACQGCWVAQQYQERAAELAKEHGPQMLALETIFQTLRDALPLGLRVVKLTGGDTLRYPYFDVLIDRLESLELAVIIETSGAGMTPERAARLARLPQCGVMVGLSGADASTHDQITRQPGSFKAAAEAIQALTRAGLASQIIFATNRRNSSQMAAAVHMAEELGASSLRFLAGSPSVSPVGASTPGPVAVGPAIRSLSTRPLTGLNGNGNGNGNGHKPRPQSDMLTVEELIAMSRRMERELTQRTHVHLSFDLPPAFRGLHPFSRIEGQGRCEVLNQLSLLPGGKYSLCSAGTAADQGLIIGQAGQDKLSALWREHPLLQNLRSSLPDELDGVCERCIMKTACQGNCAVENYVRHGSFCHPHWFCETADRVGLFPASRLSENRW